MTKIPASVLATFCVLCLLDGAFAAADAGLMQGWSLARGWRLDSSAGRSGDPALVWQSILGAVGSSSRTVGLEPGVSYRLTAWVQAEALTNGGFAVSLEWRDPQQRYIGGKKVQEVINNDVGMIGGWRRYEAVTEPIPTDAVRSILKVETTGKVEGRLSVCGITLEPTATKWMEFLSSSAYRDTAWEGTVRFAAPLFVNEVRHPLPTVGCELAVSGSGRPNRNRRWRGRRYGRFAVRGFPRFGRCICRPCAIQGERSRKMSELKVGRRRFLALAAGTAAAAGLPAEAEEKVREPIRGRVTCGDPAARAGVIVSDGLVCVNTAQVPLRH